MIPTTSTAHTVHNSSYRVKFRRKEFLELVEVARPTIVYQVRRRHFFSFDGIVMYSLECKSEDFIDLRSYKRSSSQIISGKNLEHVTTLYQRSQLQAIKLLIISVNVN
ncbi:MAG: hypothetical protein ACXAC8_05495 [Candidatus Hodarchaeales archaeon]